MQLGGKNFTTYGVEVVGYATPNLAISGNYDGISVSGGNLNNFGVSAEWKPWTATPVSFNIGYLDTTVSGAGGNLNTFSIGAKWYFGGGSTLVEEHRSGPEVWGTKPLASSFIF